MGIYSEYLDRQMSFPDLVAERKRQLQRVSTIRGGRDVLVFAADMMKGNASISLSYGDLLPLNDQLANLRGKKLDLILETPGGSGEVAEDLVRLLHAKFDEVAVIVPGAAKSAGTIIAMAGDEILMEDASSLGPIDAQLGWQGKVFSAHALIEGFEKIKEEVLRTQSLNRAYIPMLQGISPGELQSAQNALDFAKTLVTDWLTRYKFKNWLTHSSTGKPVTEDERRKRAEEIAAVLCDHGRWKTHGRSIKIADLEAMRLKIVNYSTLPELFDAIRRYHTLLQMTFATNIYKVFETPTSQVYRFLNVAAAPLPPAAGGVAEAIPGEIRCLRCDHKILIQLNLRKDVPLLPEHLPFPASNRIGCPKCGAELDLSDMRREVEAMTKRPVVV